MNCKTRKLPIQTAVLLAALHVLFACMSFPLEGSPAQRPAPTPVRINDQREAGEPERVELEGGKYKLVYRNKAGEVIREEEYALGVLVRKRFIIETYPDGREAMVWIWNFGPKGWEGIEDIRYDSSGNPQERITERFFPPRIQREKWNPKTQRWEPAPERRRWNRATGKWEEVPENETFNPETGTWIPTPSASPAPKDSSFDRSDLLIDSSPPEVVKTVAFESAPGKVMLNLPAELTAGATISGTVSIAPNGQDQQTRSQNTETLNDQLLDLGGQQVSVGAGRFKWTLPLGINNAGLSIFLRSKDQREIDREAVSVTTAQPHIPESFEFPNLIERGRPFEIRGPFDGNFVNTKLLLGGTEITPLAESPGKLLVRNTSTSTGPATISCQEQDLHGNSQVRTIAVKLGAAKLRLLRGEQTTLTVVVTGLKGIKEATPLVLANESPGVVSMSGGVRQELTITPAAQEANDSFSTERTLTGITPGGFNISARLNTRQYDVWLKEVPDKETWFDSAMDAFRSGRQLADIASDAANQGSASAEIFADEALRQLSRARTYVSKAVNDGSISLSTAASISEAISRFETQALAVKRRLRETLAATPTPSPSPPPASRPEPSPSATVTEGRFEPSQGVWQDDEYFADKPTKRLTRTGPASWLAELKMVVGRRTALFGIREDRHSRILIRGTTNGTRLTPVKFRFTLFYAGKQEVIYEERRAENQIPLDGPIGPVQPFEASLLCSTGIPDGYSFKIDSPGSYRIEGELIRNDGTPTGLKVVVRGEAIETRAPRIRVVPVMLSGPSSQASDLENQAKRIALLGGLIDEFFPVKPASVTATAEPAYDLRPKEESVISSLLSKLPFTGSSEQETQDTLVATIGQRFGTASSLTGGEKIAVLLSAEDFALTIDETEVFAYAVAQKVFVLQPRANQYTIGHEFIHTTPFAWTVNQMLGECGLNYHNNADANYGNGVYVGSYQHTRLDRVRAVMGPALGSDTWITQCSYWHLLKYLTGTPDPDLLLVRGYLAKRGASVAGSFDKFYELRGESELQPGQRTADGYSIVLRDRSNRVLAEYPFQAVWQIPDLARERKIIPFTYRVERFPRLHRVDLVGPGGVLDSKTLSANAPGVKILSPVSNEVLRPTANGLPVSWTANDADGEALSYSVYFSPDGGKNWRLAAYEQTGTSTVIQVRGRPASARVRVIATDGARSSTDEIGFSFER